MRINRVQVLIMVTILAAVFLIFMFPPWAEAMDLDYDAYRDDLERIHHSPWCLYFIDHDTGKEIMWELLGLRVVIALTTGAGLLWFTRTREPAKAGC